MIFVAVVGVERELKICLWISASMSRLWRLSKKIDSMFLMVQNLWSCLLLPLFYVEKYLQMPQRNAMLEIRKLRTLTHAVAKRRPATIHLIFGTFSIYIHFVNLPHSHAIMRPDTKRSTHRRNSDIQSQHDLLVFGYSSRIFEAEQLAASIEDGNYLQAWRDETDVEDPVLIDRYGIPRYMTSARDGSAVEANDCILNVTYAVQTSVVI